MAYVIKGRSKKIRRRRKKEKKRKKKSISSVPYIMQSRRELELYVVVVNAGVVAVFVVVCFILLC